MIIKDSDKKLLKLCTVLGILALVLFILFNLVFPAKSYAANPIGKAEGDHNHVTFGDAYFDGFTQTQFHTDTYYNGYTNTAVTSGAGIFQIPAGKFRHVTEMVSSTLGPDVLVASGTATNSTAIDRREYFRSQIWASAYPQALLGATTKSTHYVTYGSSTKSMKTSAYLVFTADWPLPFSDKQSFATKSNNIVTVKGEGWIPALATNGKLGLVKKDQYEAIINETLSRSPEEALNKLQEYNSAFSNAMERKASDEYLVNNSSEDIESVLYDDVIRAEDLKKESKSTTESLSDTLNIAGISSEDSFNLICFAKYSAGVKIPVYDFSGETIVGDFVIDLR